MLKKTIYIYYESYLFKTYQETLPIYEKLIELSINSELTE